VARLVERGHRRIALANTERGVNLSYLFEDAYRSALASHGIDYDPTIVLRGEITELGGYQVCERLLSLEAPPTAAILVNESLAMGFYRCLHDAGLTPGRDMAIIGFRQNPQSRFLSPALTCYRLSLHDLGVELAQSLLATMPAHREQYPQSLTQKIWPLELVAGESDPPPRA
jgi:DNA-binding LacI/PurR family transcriptional regulator